MNDNIIKLKIKDKHLEKAKKYSELSIDHTFDRISYDNKIRKEKIYLGKIGEEVFFDFLRSKNIIFEEDLTSAEEEDNFDLKINGFEIDIKTISYKKFQVRLLEVKNKFDNCKQYDYYVGIKLNESLTEATVYGYATKEDIKNAPVKKFTTVEDYWIYLDKLRPIMKLIDIFKEEKEQKGILDFKEEKKEEVKEEEKEKPKVKKRVKKKPKKKGLFGLIREIFQHH
jgi:hypothetical protein